MVWRTLRPTSLWMRLAWSLFRTFSRRSFSSVCVARNRLAANSVLPMWSKTGSRRAGSVDRLWSCWLIIKRHPTHQSSDIREEYRQIRFSQVLAIIGQGLVEPGAFEGGADLDH